jgi:hypothetical protein
MIIFGLLTLFAMSGCATAPPPYVCQSAVTETGQPALVCQPVDKSQIVDRPAPRQPARTEPRDGA